MYCSRCGKALRDDDRFCSFCGAKVFRTDIEPGTESDEIVFNPDFNGEEQKEWDDSTFEEDEADLSGKETDGPNSGAEESENVATAQEAFAATETDAAASTEENKQEDVQAPSEKPEFVWNLHEFPSDEPRKTEDINFNWRINTLSGFEKPVVSGEAATSLQPEDLSQEASQPAKDTADDVLNQVLDVEAKPAETEKANAFANEPVKESAPSRPQEPPVSQNEEAITGKELEKEIFGDPELSEEEKQTIKIEKFYTFNKKKEEFQLLLDREAEKIRKNRMSGDAASEGDDLRNIDLKSELERNYGMYSKDASAEKQKDVSQLSGGTADSDAYEKWKPEAQMEELRKQLEAAAVLEDRATEKTAGTSENAGDASPKAEGFDPVQHLKKATEEREECLRSKPSKHDDEAQMGRVSTLQGIELDIMDNDALARRFDTVELTKDMQEIYLEKELQKQSAIAEAEKKEQTIREAFMPASQREENRPREEEAAFRVKTEEQIPQPKKEEPAPAPKPEKAPRAETYVSSERPPQPFSKTQALDELFGIREKEQSMQQDDPSKRDKKQGGAAGKVLAAIVVLVLIGELTILAVRAFAPESTAAKFFQDKMSITYEWLLGSEEKEAPKEEAKETSPAAIVTTPEVDKEKLIEKAKSANKNIARIESEPTLAYNPTVNYNDEKIAASVPLEMNIWYVGDNGDPVYFDEEIVRTLIAFNSRWVDYVNKKDEAVFDFIKTGSKADENARAYEKAGKINETFELLQIGEIRKSDTGYYIWASEQISIAENGSSQSKTSNWVYYLEPEDNKMKICSYTGF